VGSVVDSEAPANFPVQIFLSISASYHSLRAPLSHLSSRAGIRGPFAIEVSRNSVLLFCKNNDRVYCKEQCLTSCIG
jgi:hypothetical protein